MDNQTITARCSAKSQEQSQSSAKRYTRFFLGFCMLFIVSAVSFCPVTQAALAAALAAAPANLLPSAITGLKSGAEWIAHLAFFSLLVIGLRMRTKYQD